MGIRVVIMAKVYICQPTFPYQVTGNKVEKLTEKPTKEQWSQRNSLEMEQYIT